MFRNISAALVMALAASGAHAATLNFTNVRSNGYSGFGLTVDAATGKFYERSLGNSTIREYDTQAAFEAQTPSRSFSLASGPGGVDATYGSYFAVRDGKVFQHGSLDGNNVARWDLATGAYEAAVSISGFDGTNSTGFDWGGGSSMNIFETLGGMYVMSGASTGPATNYAIAALGNDLSVTGAQTVSLLSNGSFGNAQGFGFSIGGKLFLGADYNSSAFTQSVDLITGDVIAENIAITGLSSRYLSSLRYVAATDTLYGWNVSTNQLIKATGVAAALGLSGEVAEVPEPAMIGLFGLGLIGVAARRRRKVA